MKAKTVIVWTTVFLTLFYIVSTFSSSVILAGVLYLSFPLVIASMVIIVLKDQSLDYQELDEDDEFGYADKKKEDLWIL